jgi:hypothetical protein
MMCMDKDGFKNLFNIITSLLRAGGESRKIILTPLVRYPTKACCENPDYLTNFTFRNRTSKRTMLTEAEEWLRNLAFFMRISEVTIVTPHELLNDGGEEETTKASSTRLGGYWAEDPVHMSSVGYSVMAKPSELR